jgi:D-alanyl-lipoteichoic acid acyltransferase DltB (MBOAT superfamily)
MFFNSLTYLIFLFLAVSIYWLSARKFRVFILVALSCIFYGFWRWDFLLLILFSTVLDYSISLLIFKNDKNNFKRKILLIVSVSSNLLLLGYFKYLYFIVDNINFFINGEISLPNIILPFGISFYTFETISYTTDVYRRLIKPEKNLITYSLFVTFFPKLVAGPIQRTSEFLNQVNSPEKFKLSNVFEGLKRILNGLFLKVVLADNISPIVDQGFLLDPELLSALDVSTLAFLFGFQIYFDFAGYSNIAIGSARLFGFIIPENFNFPYIATSFKDFWKRWHISLSSWIRDYLYLPLMGVHVGKTTAEGGIGEKLDEPKLRNKNFILFITWAIMGLWHGANWTFLLWGLIHSVYIFSERIISKSFKNIININIKWFTVFFLSMLSWIPFRASSVSDSLIMYSHFIDFSNFFSRNLRENNYLIAFLLSILFVFSYYFTEHIKIRNFQLKYTTDVIKYTFMLVLVYIFLRPIQQFIYFQF